MADHARSLAFPVASLPELADAPTTPPGIQDLLIALRESTARTHAILETAVDGIITIDDQGVIETFNPAAERLFGYQASQVIGQNISILMPEPYRQEHHHYLARYRASGVRHIIGIGREVQGLRQNGDVFPMLLAVSEVTLADRRIFTGIVHDISQLRQAEAELEQRVQARTAQLASANEEIRRFVYVASHDLRAPLINLQGFVGELRLACATIHTALQASLPYLSAEQRQAVVQAMTADVPEALHFIDASVSRMESIIRTILQLARLGQRQLHSEDIDLPALIDRILNTMAHQIAERQVQVQRTIPPVVRADFLALERILSHLLSNAVNYLEPGRPGMIRITAQQHAQYTEIAITDNGRGIAAEDIPKIFEAFRRVGKQDIPGEGIGLAYVEALVRRHGGQIRCDSTPGVGTTFVFTLARQLQQGEEDGG